MYRYLDVRCESGFIIIILNDRYLRVMGVQNIRQGRVLLRFDLGRRDQISIFNSNLFYYDTMILLEV